jgi:N-acetylglutamate synthase-like GNAT family acetyltransferase
MNKRPLTIRPANKNDWTTIKELLFEVDLYYSALIDEAFWVAEQDGRIVGVLQFKEYEDFFFLSSLAVRPEARGNKIASQMIEQLAAAARKPIYLYTIIPEFFKKLGFQASLFLPGLPSRDRYECVDCHPGKCVCLVRRPNDT